MERLEAQDRLAQPAALALPDPKGLLEDLEPWGLQVVLVVLGRLVLLDRADPLDHKELLDHKVKLEQVDL